MQPILDIRRGTGSFLPNYLPNLLGWYKFNTGITITGAGVSQWNDQSGLGFHLTQGTDTNRPSYIGGVITFDGVDNYLTVTYGVLKAQPLTVYMRARQITWTLNDPLDDNDGAQGGIQCLTGQLSATPTVGLYADSAATALNTNWPVDANFYSVCSVFNGASSSLRIGNTAKTTGNPGTDGRGGTNLGKHSTAATYSNWAVKEYIIYSAAHSDADQTQLINYMNGI